MKSLQTGDDLAVAAAKAGMDEKTARKWRRVLQPPSQTREPRNYRTRPDAFLDLWPEIERLLERDTRLEARTIFDHLCRQYPGRFQESQLRTLQRRVKVWRAQKGAPREVFFPQVHVPGRQAQSDFTHMTELNVTIGRQLFKHLFYHFTLTYSNWEWGMVCASESWESLCEGLQNALWTLGGVPVEHRTDSLSAAVKPIGNRNEFTDRYQGLLRHYGLQASHSSPGRGHENGDVEQSHHRFKKAVEQELILRGSQDFDSLTRYEEFLQALLERRNEGRVVRLREELTTLRGLPERRLEGFTLESQRVGRNSTISVRGNFYSVPSQLIGERIEVRIHGGHLEVWHGGTMVERMERLRGEGKARINYRHIIHSLVRKPGAFAHYRFQSALYPRVIFRVAYDEMRERLDSRADRDYVKLLKLAADEGEEAVAGILHEMIGRGDPIAIERIGELLGEQRLQSAPRVPAIELRPTPLDSYDRLIGKTEVQR